MTRPHRRDADTKNGSPVTGLRMDPDLAERLTDAARADAEHRGELNHLTRRGIANIGREVRIILRAMLYSDGKRQQGHNDPKPGGWLQLCAGLKVDPKLFEGVHRYRKNTHPQLGISACVRHLLRLGLGWHEVASLETEMRYTEIAQARRAIL